MPQTAPRAAGVLAALVGFAAGAALLGIDPDLFLAQAIEQINNRDLMTGMIKSVVFALIVGVFCSHRGLMVSGGAEEVGRATMVSVVYSIILVVVANAILTVVFYA